MGDRPEIQIHGPDGQQIEKHRQRRYTPPSRERVAEVVQECETAIQREKHEDGESPLGALLWAASEKLYGDASTDRHKSIFPHALLVEVLTEARVRLGVGNFYKARNYSLDECLTWICGDRQTDKIRLGRFVRVFTVLLLCDRPHDIFTFFDKDVSDKDFPFDVGSRTIRSKSWGQNEDKGFHLNWARGLCQTFVLFQWSVFLPYFSDDHGHQEFEEETVMPWHDYHPQRDGDTSLASGSTDGGSSALGGGHSVVSRVVIHDGHYNFSVIKQHVATFAVKKLKADNEVAFNQEVAMLRNLGGRRPHTVKLLATFRHGRTYSLLFPWAECDLLAYWHRDLGQGITSPLIAWAASQCRGLVSALEWIHNPGDSVLDTNKNELFGRHGDIKPENILWYKEDADGPHTLASGQLVFSDFGLSSLNHKDTRSNIHNGDILCTTTYAPPESILRDEKISRAIDIWSLGCVFLEFVTWIIGGPALVDKFQANRFAPHLGTTPNRDIFWEVQEIGDRATRAAGYRYVAVVKPQVVKWMKDLRENTRATRFIREFLNIIENDMLVIKKENRAEAKLLKSKFDDLKRKCDSDQSYYTARASHPFEKSTIQQPLARHLSIAALDTINRGSVSIPRYPGPVQAELPRSGETHLRP
ncbi:Kinase-like domain-containing protein [Madurella fahalii]|uniref:Kinase-like domain-containing protein n=1 Tax=Madurella fahalii TaxID=1157608 RepID=A0ABQ0GD52_9PEZI